MHWNTHLCQIWRNWKEITKYQFWYLWQTFIFISADKSDQYIPKISNDICMENLSLVRYDWTEKKVLNINTDICDETFRFISADKSDQFVPNVSNEIYIQILIFVRSERIEKKELNISSDICYKTRDLDPAHFSHGSGSMDPKIGWIRDGSNMDLDPRALY